MVDDCEQTTPMFGLTGCSGYNFISTELFIAQLFLKQKTTCPAMIQLFVIKSECLLDNRTFPIKQLQKLSFLKRTTALVEKMCIAKIRLLQNKKNISLKKTQVSTK